MDGTMSISDRVVGGLLAGLGVALSVLGFMDSRFAGQRVLYIVAGAMFLIAGVVRLIRKEPPQPS